MPGTIQYAQAPIAPGTERCMRLWDGAQVELTEDVPGISDEISILIDAQPECEGIHPLLRWSDPDAGRALGLELRRDRLEEQALVRVWNGGCQQ